MIGIIKSVQLKWPYYVTNFFNIIVNFGFISADIIGIDCYLSEMKLEIPKIYLKAIFTLAFYLLLIFTGFSFFVIRHIVFLKKNQFYLFIMFFLVVSIMIQPNSIKEGSDFLTCQKVGEKSYLIKQMTVECYTENHHNQVFIYFIFMKFSIDYLSRNSNTCILGSRLSFELFGIYLIS